MIGLEGITGTGVAVFYPASQALIPRDIRTFRNGDAPAPPAPGDTAAVLEADPRLVAGPVSR